MFKNFFLFIGFSCLISCHAPQVDSQSKPISHQAWTHLLQKHVDTTGIVNYQTFKADSSTLQAYLQLLSDHHPNPQHWSANETKAYWINAYNAFTIALIIKHYPTKGIKTIKAGIPFVNSVWDIPFIEIEGQSFDLNNIEHGILRKQFDDPRIHFALVCASKSCPKLANTAFTAATLDQQLDNAAYAFFKDPTRNDLLASPPKLSKLLSWYWIDFDQHYSSRSALINRYTEHQFSDDQDFDFLDYDWSLNDH